MKHHITFLALLLSAGCALSAKAPRFVKHPDVCGDRVVFAWDGDIWTGSLKGGDAQRLTSHPGTERSPRFSPDGKWIAFTGSYDGGSQVYVMPSAGGAPKRLTWRGFPQVQGWTPDGKNVLFTDAVEVKPRPVSQLFTVDLEGHEPEKLPLVKAMQGTFSKDGRLAFSSKGSEEYYWKRYKGGDAQDLWLGDLKAMRFEPLTDYPGKNASPMWVGDKLIFSSDRGQKGISNLFELDLATKAVRQLTDYTDFDVVSPSSDGKTVVFAQSGYLTAMDVESGKCFRVDLNVTNDDWKLRPRTINPQNWLLTQALGSKGLVLEARGDLFWVDPENQLPSRNLTNTSGTRERLPVLSPDGTQVAYVSDQSGNYDLYVKPLKGGEAVRIKTDCRGFFSRLIWSPDGKKILFGDQSFALYVADVASNKVQKLASSNINQNDQFVWEQADYVWAPDSTWVAYGFQEENRHGRIWLHNVVTGVRVPVTDGFYACYNPCFDADGSRLYFLSHSNSHSILDPSQDNHIQNAPVQVMSVALSREPEASNGKEKAAFRIDLEGLSERVTVLPIKAGNHFHLKAGKGVLGFSSMEHWTETSQEELFRSVGNDEGWSLSLYDLNKKQTVEIPEKVTDWHFSPSGDQMLIRKGTKLHVGSVASVFGKNLPPALNLDGLSMTLDPRQEWQQIHQDTWRLYRDFFYDKNMHGNDWKAIGDKHRAWIEDCPNRADLNTLLSNMVGELCVGHTYVGGGDFGPNVSASNGKTFTGLLGADFEMDKGFYRFRAVYGPTAIHRDLKAPLFNNGFLAKAGDYLLAINGKALKAPAAIHEHLQVQPGQKIKLTVNAKPTQEGAREIEVEPLRSENQLRYEAWVAHNIAEVDRLSKGQLGYMHITAMGQENLGQFDKYWRAFRFKKGIVVDVRSNGGGWTEYFLIDKLERKQVGFNVMRDVLPFRYPNTASDGRYVFVSNEENASDGECFLSHVKARNLGTIVGTRSWGGLVGIINAHPTIDGGSINQPNNGFYGKEGKWWVENHGAVPDVEVENGPDPKDGDKQLRVAVETLLKQLQEQPTPALPERPAYPVR